MTTLPHQEQRDRVGGEGAFSALSRHSAGNGVIHEMNKIVFFGLFADHVAIVFSQ